MISMGVGMAEVDGRSLEMRMENSVVRPNALKRKSTISEASWVEDVPGVMVLQMRFLMNSRPCSWTCMVALWVFASGVVSSWSRV